MDHDYQTKLQSELPGNMIQCVQGKQEAVTNLLAVFMTPIIYTRHMCTQEIASRGNKAVSFLGDHTPDVDHMPSENVKHLDTQ